VSFTRQRRRSFLSLFPSFIHQNEPARSLLSLSFCSKKKRNRNKKRDFISLLSAIQSRENTQTGQQKKEPSKRFTLITRFRHRQHTTRSLVIIFGFGGRNTKTTTTTTTTRKGGAATRGVSSDDDDDDQEEREEELLFLQSSRRRSRVKRRRGSSLLLLEEEDKEEDKEEEEEEDGVSASSSGEEEEEEEERVLETERMMKKNFPVGTRYLINRNGGKNFSIEKYRWSVLGLTFLSYTMYHATRKPPSIVKSVLNPDSTQRELGRDGWEPFSGPDGNSLLGSIDVSFLAAYSIGMFFSGHIGDSMDLRKFLTIGMIGSGFFVCLFGMAYFWDIHSMYYFVPVQIMAGVFQSTGWPSVVSVVGNWFGKSKRGLIMGIWNAHTSVGNILGSLIAARCLRDSNWGMSFIIPGILMAVSGLVINLFLVVDPEDAGHASPHDTSSHQEGGDISEDRIALTSAAGGGESMSSMASSDDERASTPGLGGSSRSGFAERHQSEAVGFRAALRIPGVVTFSLCLFFTKLVAYTFLYWLPFYIERTEIGGEYLSAAKAGELSTLFDIGGVVGGILAGYLSDKYNARSMVSAGFVYASIPVLYLYREYGSLSMNVNIGFMMLAGVLVNGPYALITTAVSADLGTHESLKGNAKALATVTAIIDGTGSIGAAIGPMLTGYISSRTNDWNNVFYMLYTADLVAGLLLTRLVLKEIRTMVAL
jgi:OPA family glycerol-3-phosphate transporter-like MFS transporter 1/2